MKQTAAVKSITREEYLKLAPTFLDYNYRQSISYAELAASQSGSQNEAIAIEKDGHVIGIANVRIKTVSGFPTGLAYILGGPLIRQEHQQSDTGEIFKHVTDCLMEHYSRKRGLVLRILNPPDGTQSDVSRRDELIKSGFGEKSNQYSTILVGLVDDEDDIRRSFHQKWRNCLNKSEKKGIEVVCGTAVDMFDEFAPLLAELKDRKSFSVNLGTEFFQAVQQAADDSEKFVVHLAYFEGRIVAGHIGSILGDTGVYLLGAATEEGNKLSASYLLQWQFMRICKQNGCSWYDLGGIDKEMNPGVFRFKDRMGGEHVCTDTLEYGSRMNVLLLALAEWVYTKLKRGN